MATLSYDAVQLRPGAECVNTPSYVVTVSCYYSKKNFLRDSDRSYTTQPVQICELAIYVLEQKKQNNNIINFHLKITMFYSREK